jgi:hypothetical protein
VTICARYGLDGVPLNAPGLVRLDFDLLNNGWVADCSSPRLTCARADRTASRLLPQGFALKLTDPLIVCQSWSALEKGLNIGAKLLTHAAG